MKKVRKAIIPAAGFGTRFLPYTKSNPKEMINIVDKPAIQYIVEEAVAAGIEDILIIVSRNKTPIEDYFDKSPELEAQLKEKNKDDDLALIKDIHKMANVFFKRQGEMLGLGHAVLQAESFVGDEPFAVLLGDDIVDSKVPCLKQLIESYNKYDKSILGVQAVDWSQVNKYGIAECDKLEENNYLVKSLVEKPDVDKAKSNIAVLGRYILTPNIFDELKTIPRGVGGEFQLTDAIKSLMEKDSVYACDFEGLRYDTGNKLGYLRASVEFALKHPQLAEDFSEYLKSLNL